jgi:formylglycine-generating enzyme required for sulfatase activity
MTWNSRLTLHLKASLPREPSPWRKLTRREVLKLAADGGAILLGGLLTGCGETIAPTPVIPTATGTLTPTGTTTQTPAPTATATPTGTATATQTLTATLTPTRTATPTWTPTPSPTATASATATRVATPPPTVPASMVLKLAEGIEIELLRIPAGEFLMGSDPKRDPDADEFEQPQHRLHLPEYHLGRTPVTISQYEAFVRAMAYAPPYEWEEGKPPAGKGNHPVESVSWYDALAFCRWASEASGQAVQLPSEAEWEKAARGADGRIYPWGDVWDVTRCTTEESGIWPATTPVDRYPQGASPYGLLDMAGNIWQWTRSMPEPYPYDPGDGREIFDPREGEKLRVMRGGSSGRPHKWARCACRTGHYFNEWGPDTEYGDVGFRVVVSPSVRPLATVTPPVTPSPTLPPSMVLRLAEGVQIELLRIPAGEFVMGSDPARDPMARADEQPQHKLSLPEYHLARTPVTSAQWDAFVAATGYDSPASSSYSGEDAPIDLVSWHDALAFCRWASEVSGQVVQLPSEAEWEKGARGADGRIYPWGDEWDATKCHSAEIPIGMPDESLTAVDRYPQGASPYGLLDMAGNCDEWTRSIYRPYPYDPADGRESLEGSEARATRGGSGLREDVRCASRLRYDPKKFSRRTGFRVMVSAGSGR